MSRDERLGTTAGIAGMTREQLLRGAAAGALGASALWALAGCGGSDGGTATGAASTSAGAGGTPRRGGRLRVGVSSGSTLDIIDGQSVISYADTPRRLATFEGLSYFDESFRPKLALAEEIEATSASQWTIRLIDGVEFHNGKTLTADDLIYSIRRTLNPKAGALGFKGLSAIDPKRIQKLDARTVRLQLSAPDSNLLDALSQHFQGVVPEGYSPNGQSKGPLRFVGTGPYKVKSFTPGQQSVHVRNENYWRDGEPYLDEIVIIDLADPTARANALMGGQVDMINQVPFAQVEQIKASSGLAIYETENGAFQPFYMRVDKAPFSDVRVRQALKLIPNRQQVITQALGGHGRVANDIPGLLDPAYTGDTLPQREQDIEQAKSLLAAAGHADLQVELTTTNAYPGVQEAAQVFAENAKAAGVSVKLTTVGADRLYGDNFLKWSFMQDSFPTRNYLAQAAISLLPSSSLNSSHFDNPRFNALYDEARKTIDETKRNEVIAEMQKIEYDEGGTLILAWNNWISAYSDKVRGLKPDPGQVDLNMYGHGFRSLWLS